MNNGNITCHYKVEGLENYPSNVSLRCKQNMEYNLLPSVELIKTKKKTCNPDSCYDLFC